MNKKRDILSEIDRRSGMTVPEGYFDDFAARMATLLPDKQPEALAPPTPKRKLMMRWRPYIYMAAMFAGIWCMMKMFSLMGDKSTDLSIDNYPGVITALSNDNFVKDYVYPDFNEYDIIEDLSSQGISPDDFFVFDDEDPKLQ